jgi:disulfide bond formation protein DsbB
MRLTTRVFAGFVLIASAIVLGAALASEYWGGLAPCELCLLQRWPWAAAIVVSLVVLFVGERARLDGVALLFAIVFAVSIAFAFYHVGVEQHWFAGPTACTASGATPTSLEALKAQLLATQPVRCDEPAWTFSGVSLAGWNLVASLIMLGCCIAALLHARGIRRHAGAERGLA